MALALADAGVETRVPSSCMCRFMSPRRWCRRCVCAPMRNGNNRHLGPSGSTQRLEDRTVGRAATARTRANQARKLEVAVAAVAGFQAAIRREQAMALVVTDRVDADAGAARQVSDAVVRHWLPSQ